MKNHVPFGTMHFAPETRWATHSSRGRRPFDARPNSLTPSAHWTGSPTTFFFSRIAVRKPAAASGRAAIPPAGPAPTTTASYIPGWRGVAAISALRAGLGGEPHCEVLAVRRRPVHVGWHATSDRRAALFRDQLDSHQDAQAVDRRVLGEAELLGHLHRTRVRMEMQEPKDRNRVAVQCLRRLFRLGPRLEFQPLIHALALLRWRYDDIQQRGLLDLEQVLRDRRRRDAHLGRELRDLRVPVAVHFVLHNDRKDLALTFREEARPVARVHPGRRTSRAVLSVFVERRREGLCLTTSEYDSVAPAWPADPTRRTRSKAISSGPIPATRWLVCPAT